jgi:hypothetical protein
VPAVVEAARRVGAQPPQDPPVCFDNVVRHDPQSLKLRGNFQGLEQTNELARFAGIVALHRLVINSQATSVTSV